MSRDEKTLKPNMDYASLPHIKGRSVILTDTMLATGGSLLDAIKIVERYNPKQILVISAIASEPGIQRILAHNPTIKIYTAAVDPASTLLDISFPALAMLEIDPLVRRFIRLPI